MNLDVDFLINFFDKYSGLGKSEITEDEPSSGGGGGKGNSPSKWADTVGGPKRGVANSLPKKGQYWASLVGGPARGVGNKLGTA